MKKGLIIFLVIVFVITMIPLRYTWKDGGSYSYRAILWQYTRYHRMLDADGNYLVGSRLTLLWCIPVIDTTREAYLPD